jgi:ABC-type Fe3+-hydroxamate transport system substrate-binding protein
MLFLDQMNRKVELKDFPERIVSLVPSQSELLFYLLDNKKVVGITRFCIHPKDSFLKTTKIGGTKDFDFAKIDALKPDLIIGNKEENYKDGIEKLAEKYPVWMSDINTVEDALQMIKLIGKLVNQPQKAQLLAEQIANKFHILKERVKQHKQPKVAYLIWRKPLMVAGNNNFIHDILTKIGLDNVYAEKNSRYPETSEEELTDLNPDFIFLSSEPYPFKEKHIEYFASLCPKATIKVVDGEMFSWYGNRMLQSADYLAKLIKTL